MHSRPAILLAGILISSTPLAAQQKFELWPDVNGFATRGTVGMSAGETLQGFHANVHRGLGDFGRRCEITGFTAVLQDQNAATVEYYDIAVRHGSDSAGPSKNPGDLVGKIWTLQTPKGTGRQAWSITMVFSVPMRLRDCATHFAAGIGFPASPALPADGLMSLAATAKDQLSHSRQEEHAWDFIGTSTVATRPSHKRTYRYGLLLPGVVMQLGNGGLSYGMGGMFPRTGVQLTARLRGGTGRSNAAALVALSTKQFRLTGVPLGPGARIYLSPNYHFYLTRTNTLGEATVVLTPSVSASFAGVGTFHFQGAIDSGGITFSNCQTVVP